MKAVTEEGDAAGAAPDEGGANVDPGGNSDGGGGWQKIEVGQLVLTQEKKGEAWFEALVTKESNGILTLRWRDWSDWPVFARRVEQVALLHPKHRS